MKKLRLGKGKHRAGLGSVWRCKAWSEPLAVLLLARAPLGEGLAGLRAFRLYFLPRSLYYFILGNVSRVTWIKAMSV